MLCFRFLRPAVSRFAVAEEDARVQRSEARQQIIREPAEPNGLPDPADERRHDRAADIGGCHLQSDDRLRVPPTEALGCDMQQVGEDRRAPEAEEQQPREGKALRQRQREQQRAQRRSHNAGEDEHAFFDAHREDAGDHAPTHDADEKHRPPSRGDAGRNPAHADEIGRSPEPDGRLRRAVEKE